MSQRPNLDIVIPARGEARTIGRCLTSILFDGATLALRVIVVLNGEEIAETSSGLESAVETFADHGHELIVVSSPPSKAAALNVGDGFRRTCCIIYLDADVVILPGTLGQLWQVLQSTSAPRLASPRIRLLYGDGRLSRDFGLVWSQLPLIQDGVIGGGCYAVNVAGRSQWSAFPNISGDDAFVCALFPPCERIAVTPAGIVVEFPTRLRRLVAMRERWLRSAREGVAAATEWRGLQAKRHVSSYDQPLATDRLKILKKPRILAALPIFILIDLLARFRLVLHRFLGRPSAVDWPPDRERGAMVEVAAHRPRVRVVIVSHNNQREISGCLASLRSTWACLDVYVIDTASSDETVAEVRKCAGVNVHQTSQNVGFGRAVNIGAHNIEDVDYVLLLNPDTILEPNAIDVLLALMIRSPSAGIIGPTGLLADGSLHAASCLLDPSLGQALRYALGWSTGLSLPRHLHGDGSETRYVSAISGACLLVTKAAWIRLGGFDERFFLYGEDIDLCIRARHAGFHPTYTGLARYKHFVGRSSSSDVDRICRLLAGTVSLYRKHGGIARNLSSSLILAGVLLRLLASAVVNDRRWPLVWRRRRELMRGYDALESTSAADPTYV